MYDFYAYKCASDRDCTVYRKSTILYTSILPHIPIYLLSKQAKAKGKQRFASM